MAKMRKQSATYPLKYKYLCGHDCKLRLSYIFEYQKKPLMKLLFMSVLCTATFAAAAQKNNYAKAWDELNKSKRDAALTLLNTAIQQNENFEDAYISRMYMKAFSGKENEINDFEKLFYSKATDPFPYTYALWFNNGVAGGYSKKNHDYQLSLLDRVAEDKKAPAMLVAAANYQKGMHYLYSNNFTKAQKFYDEVGSLRNWQYTGPFENLSESGFFKDYGPLKHPEPDATFKSVNNADIKWIIPASEIKDGWIPVNYSFQKNTAIVYAQTFVTAAQDQEMYCNAGVTGSLKVWINDRLVISESKERVTDLDAFSVKCQLKKGVNRVLVQVGFSGLSYPCFSVRFTDQNQNLVSNMQTSPQYAAYSTDNKTVLPELIPFFAETFFKNKISAEPTNLVNYLLLTDVYMRNKKTEDARILMEKAIELAPDNSLLRMKMAEVFIKESNRTSLLEQIETIKKLDGESLVTFEMKLKELLENEKYEDFADLLKKRVALYGEDETTLDYSIKILIHEKKYDELAKLIEKAYVKYPSNTTLLGYMYSIKKEVYKDNKAALRLYEDYRKNAFNYGIEESYIKALESNGSEDKGMNLKLKLAESFSYDPSMYYKISGNYFVTKKYKDAEDNIRKALALSPYYSQYWEQLGDIKSEMNKKEDALNAYSKSLEYDPKQFDIIDKIRKLKGKPEIIKLMPQNDVDKAIQEDKPEEAKNKDYGYYYILDRRDVVLHNTGASEEYTTIIMRITNDKGIERYKESSIPYNDNTQSLLIESADVIKKNGTKIKGEQNGNEIVFANLLEGDILVFKYRIRNFTYGRFAKDYWDKTFFGGQIYSSVTQYNLLAAADKKIYYEFNNSTLKPVVKDVEDFKMYSWESVKPTPLKDEPYMPLMTDAGEVLHVSTISSWNDISGWYADIIKNRSEESFEIVSVYKTLFPDAAKKQTQFQKAKIIYGYIEKNIKYSSVSFRQSAFVPQKASTTINTRLGDCKDLSNLFVTLAGMAGLNAQMVLVDTRDNGSKDILLPGIEFNHCIVKTNLDGRDYYIELTDNYLPFASLPNNLNGALILEIPGKNMPAAPQVTLLKADNRTKDMVKRTIDILPDGSDLNVKVNVTKYGQATSSPRSNYSNLDEEKTRQNMEETVAGSYKNNVKLLSVAFKDLDKLNDSLQFNYSYRVKNEVTEIGSLQTFRIVYPDVVATLDNFSSDERNFPVEYWKYEDMDNYETTVNISAPAGKKFTELPKNELLSFKTMNYSIEYILKAPDKLVVKRKFANKRENIPVADYGPFKSFFEKIVKAEQKFIAYK